MLRIATAQAQLCRDVVLRPISRSGRTHLHLVEAVNCQDLAAYPNGGRSLLTSSIIASAVITSSCLNALGILEALGYKTCWHIDDVGATSLSFEGRNVADGLQHLAMLEQAIHSRVA